MNVLICCENHFVQVGDEVHFHLTGPRFFQRYRDVFDEVVILARSAKKDKAPQGSQPLDMSGVRLIGLPDFYGPRQFLREWRNCRNIARRALEQVDSIIFRAPGTISNVVWSLLGRTGRPFGVEVVGDPAKAMARGAMRHPLRPFFRWISVRNLRRQCREAYATAYVTQNSLQQDYPPAPGKFSTHYSTIELHRRQLAAAPRTDFPRNGPYRIVSVGSFATLYKAQDILLKAVGQLVRGGLPLEVVLIGAGKYRAEMEELARTEGLSDRVCFCGELPMGDAVLAELDRADLFVLPSRQEGLPRATIEAMARGLPCIGSTVGGTPELLGREDMVSPDDIEGLAGKIGDVLKDPVRMAKMSKRNLAVASEYTEDILSARRIAFYRELKICTDAWQHRGVTMLQGVASAARVPAPAASGDGTRIHDAAV